MRTLFDLKRAIPLVCFLSLLAVALIISGCGNSSDTSMAPPAPTQTAPQAHTAASGTALSAQLSFDQLTLESPAKMEKDKNGLTFLRFKYADNDGKVYECVLPKAMSEGQYTLPEWSSTFNAYRLPKVLAVKKKGNKEDLGDYPFISPRPQAQPATTSNGGGNPIAPATPVAPATAPSMPQRAPVNAPGLGPPP